MKRQFYKKNLFMFILFMLSIFTLPSTVWGTERVDTMPENLVYNGEFEHDWNQARYGMYDINIIDESLNMLIHDDENLFDGAHDTSSPFPGWSYHPAHRPDEYMNSRGVLGKVRLLHERFDKLTPTLPLEASSSEEPSYINAAAMFKEDYVYQNVAVHGNKKHTFHFLRWNWWTNGDAATNFDTLVITLVELDKNKSVLRTIKYFDDPTFIRFPVLNSCDFQTSANAAYVQIRISGDPRYTGVASDGGLDSFYLSEIPANTTAYTKVRYYSGNAANSENGNYIKTDSFALPPYTLSNVTDAEISGITPAGYILTGWKCIQNGQTYANGTQVTLPAADSRTGTVTMVAQWGLENSIQINFKRNYNAADTTDVLPGGISVDGGTSANDKWPSNPYRAGYLFMGWSSVRSPLTDTTGKMYAYNTTISTTSIGVSNKELTLYALWMEDADGNNIPDAMQVKAVFKAGANGKLTAPSAGTYNASAGTFTVYLWRGIMTDANYNTVKQYIFTAVADTAVQRIRECVGATASLSADMVPGTAADSGYAFDAWTPDLTTLPKTLNANTEFTASFKSDIYTLTLDTHGVYPLLYSGTSSQDLAFTLKDGSGKIVTDSSILNQVTFTMELTDGFEKFKDKAGYAVVTLNGSKITAKKSGVVKIYAKYKDVVSSDYAIAVVPGDLNRSGSIDLDDAVQEAVILRDSTKVSEFGTYGKELANMNNLNEGVDVDDIVKIVAMVRGISDYYN